MTSELLFELYGAPSVTYGVDSLFAFSRQQHRDGMALNLGHNSTTVIPVVDGRGILSRAKRSASDPGLLADPGLWAEYHGEAPKRLK